jgi:protein SCO1
MKTFLSCRAKSRHPDALLRVALRGSSTSLGMTVALVFGFAGTVFGLTPGDLSRVTLEQHPGLQLSHGLVFRDENGQQFRLGNSAAKQPTILVPGYYRCPMLCPLINDGLIQALQNLRMNVGRDFQVVDFSIDPEDTPADAARKKSEYLRRYGRPGAAEGWHCVVGDRQSVAQLADEIGYRYAYDPETKQYAHPSAVIVLTPESKISRYISGATFGARELRDALIAAREGESTSTLSKLFLLCYHYNPITGKYGALIMSIVRIAGVVTVLAIAAFIALMVGRDRRARQTVSETSPSPGGLPQLRDPYQ